MRKAAETFGIDADFAAQDLERHRPPGSHRAPRDFAMPPLPSRL